MLTIFKIVAFTSVFFFLFSSEFNENPILRANKCDPKIIADLYILEWGKNKFYYNAKMMSTGMVEIYSFEKS